MTYHAFYSQKAADSRGGVVEYLTADGEPVECTVVDRDPDAPGYEWPDKIYRGPVEKFSRTIVPLAEDRLVFLV